jgi:hypothetical protein
VCHIFLLWIPALSLFVSTFCNTVNMFLHRLQCFHNNSSNLTRTVVILGELKSFKDYSGFRNTKVL